MYCNCLYKYSNSLYKYYNCIYKNCKNELNQSLKGVVEAAIVYPNARAKEIDVLE